MNEHIDMKISGSSTMPGGDYRREFKFSVLVPASEYFPEAAELPAEEVLLQGVVDCMYETADGIVIVDFKTDRVRPGQETERAARYRPQLEAYRRAVQEVFGRPVCGCVLFFLHIGNLHLHLMGRSSRVRGNHHGQLDLYLGVFQLAHVIACVSTSQHEHGHEEIHQEPVVESPFAEIHHSSLCQTAGSSRLLLASPTVA